MLMIMFSRFMPGGSTGGLLSAAMTCLPKDSNSGSLQVSVKGTSSPPTGTCFCSGWFGQLFRHQDAAVVGVAGEAHAHQVPHLALGPDRAGVDAGQAGRFRRAAVVERADDGQVLLAGVGAQLVDGVKAAVADWQLGAIDGGNIDDGFVAQVRVSPGKVRQGDQLLRLHVDDLLAVMQPGGENRIAKALDEAIGVLALASRQRGNGRNS
jgi:hypothetical protein